MRPDRVVVVAGTATEVGKTWVSCALLESAQALGWRVVARKPLQSFDPQGGPTDAARLAEASGERPAEVCPEARSYPVSMAPPMAAAALGLRTPSTAEIAADLGASWPSERCDLALVEGAGGVASPLTDDGHTADLSQALEADAVVLVADAGLGVINSVRLSMGAIAGRPGIVHLNRFDPDDELHRRNEDWLAERDGYRVTTSIGTLLEYLISSGGW